MASATKKLKVRKKLKKAAAGKARKNKANREGITKPFLKLDKPTANEIAQKKKK